MYVGKSKNIEQRFSAHKISFKSKTIKKGVNRHLYSAVNFHGISNFEFVILHTLEELCEFTIGELELYYISKYDTDNRKYGYNLRKDSSTGMIVHEETRLLLSELNTGEKNGNYGKKWTNKQKQEI